MIYTFYSFKGGVGRSMALANVAACFRAKGLRVAMIDWDLEAPGLEAYFYEATPEGLLNPKLTAIREQPGLVDLLREYKTNYPLFRREQTALVSDHAWAAASGKTITSSADVGEQVLAEIHAKVDDQLEDFPEFMRESFKKNIADNRAAQRDVLEKQPRSLEEFLDSLAHEVSARAQPSKGRNSGALAKSPLRGYLQCVSEPDDDDNGILLMSAGQRTGEKFTQYAETVQDFDWAEFYGLYEGQKFFAWLRKRLSDIADVVFIDSRTGVTEMGGICTRVMADAVVCFCAPNGQNLEGVGNIIDGLKARRLATAHGKEFIDVIAVPARIDYSEEDLLEEFRKRFIKDIQSKAVPDPLRDTEEPLWSLRVPYIPKFNYREQRVIGANRVIGTGSLDLAKAYRKIAVSLAVMANDDVLVRERFAADVAAEYPDLQPPRTPAMAPAVPELWVDRPQEVAQLKHVLVEKSRPSAASRVAVWGEAGIGKTTLVARVCGDPAVRAAYPGGIVWLACTRSWTTESVEDFLRTSFGLGRRYRGSRLAEFLADKQFLLVIDDVWNFEDVTPIVAFGKQCTQLVITNNLSVASVFADSVMKVGPLDDAQAAQLLKSGDAAARLATDESADLVLSMVHWPLAASLIRTALERQLAQSYTPEQAWQAVKRSFSIHGIVAFDQPNVSDRNLSVSLCLASTIGHLSARARDVLLQAARSRGEGGVLVESLRRLPVESAIPVSVIPPDPEARSRREAQSRDPVDELTDLGLASLSQDRSRLQVNTVVYAWLLASGQVKPAVRSDTKPRRVSSSEDKKDARNPDVERAKNILWGKSADLAEMMEVAERLTGMRYYGYARRLFVRCRSHADVARLPDAKRLKLAQRIALCTYRNNDLPATVRFRLAMQALESADLHEPEQGRPEPSQETLGLTGAIHKYQWTFSGQRIDLERSYFQYERGAKQPIEGDFGYTRINAAFVADVLAEKQAVESPVIAETLRGNARRFREEIVATLPGLAGMRDYAWLRQEWWYPATLAEAYFGLQRYEEARFWLREAVALGAPEWQIETTTRQLATLAFVQHGAFQENSEAWRCLHILVGDAIPAVQTILAGKVGLALSGGGFRASFFHIGVLARLAELDLLRHVEVLSCVSGGSIVGAHYYLEVRKLLEEVPDAEITREHYIEIVRRIESDFLRGVQKNLRTRLFLHWPGNLRSLLAPSYTRTKLLGEMFERHIYQRIEGLRSKSLWLDELTIQPKDVPEAFNPKLDNWRRAAKAPILLLNATALNTGHNWQFAVSWMGEPPLTANSVVDRNDVLRRMYYWEAPRKYRKVRLGHAVAASACVPGLFDPIEMPGLYPGRILRLVDGGVHDNQGVAGLLEQECRVAIVSDASGQMNSELRPSSEVLGVPLRSNGILQARVRESEFRHVDALANASALSGLMFLHLKKDIPVQLVDWTDCQDPDEELLGADTTQRNTLTYYGMPRRLQANLAGIRTDLDSFADAEAYALMLSGYRMVDADWRKCLSQLGPVSDVRVDWNFRSVEAAVSGDDVSEERLTKLLRVGANRGFRIWRLSPAHALQGAAMAAVLLALVGYGVWLVRDKIADGVMWLSQVTHIASPSWSVIAAFAALVLLVWGVHRRRKSFSVIITGLVMLTVGWFVAGLHLLIFDPLYRSYGAVRNPRK